MIDLRNKPVTGTASAGTGDTPPNTTPIQHSAAPSDGRTAPRVPIDPDNLHDLFEGSLSGDGSDVEDPLAQLRSDPNYAALIRDLETIAEAARELFAAHDEAPSDKVWDGIQKELGKKTEV